MLPKISVSQRFFLKIHEFCPQISGRPWLATKKSVKTFYRRSLDINFYDILRRKTPILNVLLHHCMLFRYKISQKSSIFNLKSLVYRDFVYWCQGPDQISGLQRISAVYPPGYPTFCLHLAGRDSAPKEFQIFASYNTTTVLTSRTSLGSFTLNQQDPTENVFQQQTFEIKTELSPTSTFTVFEVEFLSNYGNPQFTCIYQVKVHGKAANNLSAANFGDQQQDSFNFLHNFFGSK